MFRNNLRALFLEHQIASCRRKMEALWNDRGFTDSIVLAVSIELDELLNEYQKLSLPRKAR